MLGNKVKREAKNKIIAGVLGVSLLGTGAVSCNLYNKVNVLNTKNQLLEEKLKKSNKENEENKKIINYYESDEYKETIKLSKLEEITGLNLESYYTQDFKFTYYTSDPSENGGYTVTCNGEALTDGIVASNYYPQGTKLYIDGRVYTVADKGSSRFNSPNRLDVFVGRQGGESSGEYLSRVNAMGVHNTEGYVLTEE